MLKNNGARNYNSLILVIRVKLGFSLQVYFNVVIN